LVEKITTARFKELIKSDEMPLVVDCYADWCMPCKMSSPAFAKMSEKYEGKAKFVKVNVDEEPAVSQAFSIRGVPSFFIMKGNKIKEAIVGADLKKLEASLQKLISKSEDSIYN